MNLLVYLTLQRVKIFRRSVTKEKEVLGLTESACVSPQSTLITVHRGRVVEVRKCSQYTRDG